MIRILLFVSICYWASTGNTRTLEVCKKCHHLTIESAVNAAERGDTIRVKAGIYLCQNIELSKPVVLLGDEGAILDGGLLGYILKILSDSVTISGFKIIRAGRSYTNDFAAIYSYKARHFTISNNEIIDAFFGLLIEKSKDGLIKGNKIYGVSTQEDDSGNGIHLWHCSGMNIQKNEIFRMRDGIYLEFVDNSKVIKNYSHNNVRYGLHFMFSNNDQYLGNTFETNGAGVAVMFSKFIVMKDNRFLKNWGTASYGLLLKEIYDAEVLNNTFMENTIGIFNEGSTRVNYLGNNFERNGWAIKVSGGCYANYFSKNNFTGNSFDVSYNSKMNDNRFEGNYWSSYSGYDLNNDGVGDVPYRPVKLFSYIVNKSPETIVLLRSLFVDIINFSERVSPVFTPDDLVDVSPVLNPFK